MNLETLILDDYKTIYMSHATEILKMCEKLFDLYPSLEAITLSGALKIEGNSFNLSNSMITRSTSDDYSLKVENQYKFFALIEDKNTKLVKVKSVIEENSSLFKAFSLLCQNPHYKTLAPTAPHNERQTLTKKNFEESITKVFGIAAKDYYSSFSERTRLDKALPIAEPSVHIAKPHKL